MKTITCHKCKTDVDIELETCPSCGSSMKEIREWYLTEFKDEIEKSIPRQKCYKCFKPKYNLETLYVFDGYLMTTCSNCGMPAPLCPVTEKAKEEIRIRTEIAIAKATAQLAYAPKKTRPKYSSLSCMSFS